MSNEKPSNPQVFPIIEEIEVAGRRTTRMRAGMTLRDWFAGQFMAARYSNPTSNHNLTDYDMARIAYQRADAMLKAREES